MSDEPVSKGYNLAESSVGPLRPVLKDPRGRVIDGYHRLEADPEWPTEVREDIDTDRKFFSAKIQLNTKRRTVPKEETAVDLKNLADAIADEDGTTQGIIGKLKKESGLEEPYIRSLLMLADRLSDHPSGFSAPVAVAATREGSGEERVVPVSVAESEGRTSVRPDKSSYAFQHLVEQTLSRIVGLPLESIVKRLVTAYELTEEEAQGYVERWKMKNMDFWQTLYDSNDKVKQTPTKPKESPSVVSSNAGEEEVVRSTAAKPPDGLTFNKDEMLVLAMKHYPDPVIQAIWPLVPLDSRKIIVLKELFNVTYEMALESRTPEALVDIVNART